MKPPSSPAASGRATAILVSMVGLILVWGIVWANLPSKHELLSAQPEERAAAAPSVPELDLRIPGVPAASSSDRNRPNSVGTTRSEAGGRWTGSGDFRAREIAEVKCEAEVQQACPESLDGDGRQRCLAQRMNQFPPFCRQMVRQRMVRWKEAEGYKAVCAEDVKRVCRGVEPGDGRILQCLQEQAQDISEPCYQSLPKGQLLIRR